MSSNQGDNDFELNDIESNSGEMFSANDNDNDVIREQDRLLPIANVARIMKQAVPTNAKIAKDAKDCVQACVSEFISFVTSEAAERCQMEKRKTINGDDIIWAMEALGFDQYSQLMKIYLHRYKEITKTDKGIMGHGAVGYENAFSTGLPTLNYETMMAIQNQNGQASQSNSNNQGF